MYKYKMKRYDEWVSDIGNILACIVLAPCILIVSPLILTALAIKYSPYPVYWALKKIRGE